MTVYDAQLRMEGETAPPLSVVVDLTDDQLTLSTEEDELATWDRHAMRVQALPDGFHIRAEGEAVILDVSDDARFALELGLRNAHPTLRRRMSALLREEG